MLNVTGLWDGAALLSTPNFNAGRQGEESLLPGDKGILRELAKKLAGQAALPEQQQKRELWRRHNDLQPTRPLVFCDPENGWNEILPSASLRCRGALARRWEMVLRKELFWAESLQDDKVSEPFFDIGYTHTEDDWGASEKQIGGTEGGSYVWEAALSREEDIEKLHPPAFQIDQETTRQTVSLAEDSFRDLLQVRLTGVWWWSLGLTLNLSLLRGLEQVMYDLVEHPRLVHRLDRETSGCLLIAKTRFAATALTGSFRHRSARKIYWALVAGVSDPWSCAARRPTRSTISSTSRARWSRKTPTVRTCSGTAAMMSMACSTVTCRREGAKMRPIASAPVSTATAASAALVVPQIFTNTVRDRTGVPTGSCSAYRPAAKGSFWPTDPPACGGIRRPERVSGGRGGRRRQPWGRRR